MAFVLEDDDGVVEAALSFVDECALDEVVSTSSTKSSTVSVDDSSSSEPSNDNQGPIVQSARCNAPVRVTSREEKRRRRTEINEKTRVLRKAGVYADSNRVRNGRTREIAFLRQQMERLQIDLETLKKMKKVGHPTTAGTSSETQYRDAPNSSQMWQSVLEIQRRRREEAECENIRLKLIFERQRRVADSMTSSLQKRVDGLVNDCSGFIRQNCVQHPLVHVLAFCGDMGGFQELFRHLEVAYQEVDAVFAVNGLIDMVETPDDVHIREGGDATYAEAFSNKVLHFGLRAATEATWDHFKGSEKHLGNGNIYERTARDLDEPYTIVEEFTKELFSRRSHADIKVKQVIRRYVEPDRDVVIWVARVSPAEIKHKMLSGLTYQLRGYAVTKRSSASTPYDEVSQLQCCSMILLDQDAAMKIHISFVTEQLVSATSDNMEEVDDTQAFEAAMSFVEEFSFEEAVDDGLSTLSSDYAPADAAPATRTVQPKALTEEKKRRQKEVNEKRRLLRKAGVYGDPNRIRNERTKEIAFLREQMERLHIDLKVLRTRRTQEQSAENATALIVAKSSASVPGSMWREQAARQRRRREEAERDNVLLRLAVERQKKVATDLRSLMSKRSSQLTNEYASLASLCSSQSNSVDVLDFRRDIGDFHELFYHLNVAYRDIDSVFAANGLTHASPIDVHVREGVEGKYLEFSTYKDLPFALQDTAQASWDYFKGVEKHQGYGNLYQKTAKSLDEPYTIIEEFSKEVRAPLRRSRPRYCDQGFPCHAR
ncbi:hypothetical protein PF001_g25946 [Phytophthora fragariae]|uniref:M96 mating-specific protein family n=1 Tax=Phytophthora fragariae TaxID=53985 RepID=A0A6A3HSL0_9STRA|nr:hypothetical protein PF011_g26326 [Phytophthora fragariae]KAE9177161.1 hypothetical protein PF004_g25854 [Phytophthora fragariae]KAE9276826.1 hypothetical protein PF001_g25946 [Phytophthora fragariae]